MLLAEFVNLLVPDLILENLRNAFSLLQFLLDFKQALKNIIYLYKVPPLCHGFSDSLYLVTKTTVI